MGQNSELHVCVVGAGTRFLSGISYYTLQLANALALTHKVSAILMRQLLPTRLYPGRERVGAKLTRLEYDPAVRVFDGVDWYWLPSMLRALLFLMRDRPDVVIFQWWSGTVLHSYLLLALFARLLGARIIIEFHEVLDTGEARIPLARAYVGLIAPLVVRHAHGYVAHSEYDKKILPGRYDLRHRPGVLIYHGPYHQYQSTKSELERRIDRTTCCNLLFFGVIRPYKGLEDLIRAFDALPENVIDRFRLTVVGETWEAWTMPANLIEQSHYRNRIRFINRYVRDEEVAQFFTEADVAVFPYHRSSASGPLHIAMSCGLPVVITHVGGLVEAVADYEGAILIPPKDPAALQDALLQAATLQGKRFTDPHSWEHTIAGYQSLFDTIYSS